jgi:hypothetical protein
MFDSTLEKLREDVGKRIRIIEMKGENFKSGTEGTITHIDDMCNIHVKWDNGSTLSVIPDEDRYEILHGGRR